MKILLIVLTIAHIINVSNGVFPWWLMPKNQPWYNFWRPHATETSIIMNRLYDRSKDFVLFNRAYRYKVWEGFYRMVHIMYLGICPEKVTTTTTTPKPNGKKTKTKSTKQEGGGGGWFAWLGKK